MVSEEVLQQLFFSMGKAAMACDTVDRAARDRVIRRPSLCVASCPSSPLRPSEAVFAHLQRPGKQFDR